MVDTRQFVNETGESEWKYGFCNCLDVPLMCLWSCCVPYGGACMQAVEVKLVAPSEEENALLCAFLISACLCCCGAAYNRGRVRAKYNIRGSFMVDCLLLWMCGLCSINQEWKEVMHRAKGDEQTMIWKALD